jgi:tetratricopeptide (TPR) repeat protein
MTPSYAAPEFFDGKTSSQSDQYSLAITYCHLRGGRLPFEGNPAAVIAGHLMREPDLSMIPEIERPAVARALSKSPRDRWPSCRAFIQAVMDTEGVHAPPTVAPGDSGWKRTTQPEPVTTTPYPKPERISELGPARPDSPSNSRWLYLAGATLLALGLLLAMGLLFRSRRPGGPNDGPPLAERKDPGPAPSSDAMLHIEKGLELLGKESHEPAIAEFDEAIRLDPKAAQAYAGRAFARALAPDRAGSRGASLKKAQSKETVALRESRRQMAKNDSDEALRLDPNLPLGHAARALVLTMGNSPEFSAALDESDQAIRLGSGSALVFLARAHVLFRRAFQDNRGSEENRSADLKAATKSAGRAIHFDTKLVAAYYIRGNARRMSDNPDGALDDYAEAQRLDPTNAMASFFSGLIWQGKEDHATALRHYNAAIKISPDMIGVYNKRAEVYEAMGDKARAEADRREAARLGTRPR